jgi:hypothetical protein
MELLAGLRSFDELHEQIKTQAFRLANGAVAPTISTTALFRYQNDLAGLADENSQVFESPHQDRYVLSWLHAA